MGINVIELAPEELVRGFYIAQGTPITFAELVERFGLARANELWAEYGLDGLYLDFGGTGYTTAYTTFDSTLITSGGAPAAISSTTDTALELAQSSSLTAESISATPYTQGALTTGSSAGQLSTLLSLDVGVVGAAVAPVLGVALGINLYQNNPEFWTKLSQKLLPFCYPGTTEIPAWTDIIESALNPGEYETHTIIDKRIYDLILEWFIEEGIGQAEIGTYPSKYPDAYAPTGQSLVCINGSYVGQMSTNGDYLCRIGGSVFAFSSTSSSYMYADTNLYRNWSHQLDSTVSVPPFGTVYYTYCPQGFGTDDYSSIAPVVGVSTISSVADILYNGTVSGGGYPEGTSQWAGNTPSTSSYPKQIIYLIEDPEHPGQYIVSPSDGIEVAVPEKDTVPQSEVQLTKPDNWPEDVDWPMIIEFPWNKPDGYEGEWPETMPWPLPPEKPEWWPDVIPYSPAMPMPAPSVDPQENPDPNKNTDPATPVQYAPDAVPGLSGDPKKEITPDPSANPSKPSTRPQTAYDDLSGESNPDETPEGETPVPVVPTIPTPWTPSASTPDGLITVYHPTDTQLKAFSSWLWVTYADATIDKIWNNPFDGVIGLMEIYCTPTDIGVKNIRSGFLDSGVSSQTISRYTSINCGSITVPEYYGNYLDYSPYSKCHVYLPFIGIVELNVDDVVGHAINITYRIDEYNGACIAQITVAKSTIVGGEEIDYSNLMYQFSGNCAVDLPLSGGSQASIKGALIAASATGLSSVIHGIATGAAGGVGGAIAGGALGAVSGAAGIVSNVVTQKSSVQHSGTFGSSYGALGIKTPYIIVTRPKQVIVVDYNTIYGYPAHKMVTIGSCKGYLRVREVHIKSSTASDEEKKKIEELLKEGIYVTE